MKKRIGIFSFTCCEGCTVVFIEALNKKFDEWIKQINFTNFRALKTSKKILTMDIALVEGAISTESEVKKLKQIREKSKILIALGSGAANGYPSNQRNKFTKKNQQKIQHLIDKMHQNKTIEPLKTYVKVDDIIDGCPIEEFVLIEKIGSYLKKWKIQTFFPKESLDQRKYQ